MKMNTRFIIVKSNSRNKNRLSCWPVGKLPHYYLQKSIYISLPNPKKIINQNPPKTVHVKFLKFIIFLSSSPFQCFALLRENKTFCPEVVQTCQNMKPNRLSLEVKLMQPVSVPAEPEKMSPQGRPSICTSQM